MSNRKIAWIVGGAVVATLLGAAVWTGARAIAVKDELEAAVSIGSELSDSIAAMDTARASELTDALAKHARRASDLSGDPVWRVAEVVPFVGPNLAGARIASQQIAALTDGVIRPVLKVAETLSTAAPDEAGLDTAKLRDARESLEGAVAALRGAQRELDAAPSDALIAPLAAGLTEIQRVVDDALPVVGALADASSVLPPLLGDAGPRSILVMIQNNAELRTGGGISGAFVELRAEAGSLSLVDQASTSDFPVLSAPILELPAPVMTLSGGGVGTYVMNTSTTADFDVTARLASSWWNLRSGRTPDTVVSIDPWVLSALLGAMGPVEIAGWGEVNAGNAVHRLLVDPYVQMEDNASQDALFQSVATTVFERLTSARANLVAVVTALSVPVAEGRLSVWSARPEEQAILAEGALGGPLARQRQAGPAAFAVYLNDATGAKMDSYLEVGISTAVAECRGDGLRDVTVSVTLTNTAPADAGTRFPRRMTGNGIYGVAAGSIGTYVAVSAPPGTFFGSVSRNDGPGHSTQVVSDGHPVSQARLNLEPGATDTLVFRFIAATPGEVDPVILHTPMIGDVEIESAVGECSSSAAGG